MKNILKWDEFLTEKINPEAEVRNRGLVVFSSDSSLVNDKKDHFPINDENQARNALARASQYDTVPKWYEGTLKELVQKVHNKVKEEYPDIKVTEKSENPGKD